MSQDYLGLFDTPPNRRQVKLSLAIASLLFGLLLLILPIRDIRLPEINVFIPMINAIMFLAEMITATLLYAQATIFRSRALAVLAIGYFFAALFLVPHALTFPGAFAPDGLLGAGVNTTSWIANFRRWVVPVAVILYVWLKRADLAAQPRPERRIPGILGGVVAATALAAAITLLATWGHAWLPPFYQDRAHPIYATALSYEAATFALYGFAAVTLFRQRSSLLDMWLLVAFSGWLVQSVLVMSLSARFIAGWYALHCVTLFAHLVVMLALIAESNRLYARLARSTAARNRERDARSLSMDAVAAAIAHEVGQPLSAVVTNGMVGLTALTRARPDAEMAVKSLRATIDAGKHAADVIQSVRAMFARGASMATEFDINELVREATTLLSLELTDERVSLQLALDETLPAILADRVQMRQVLLNLVTNAIESLGATQGRPRRIAIRSARIDGHDILLEVSDTGVGIPPEKLPQVFEAFFTTKATGIGLGLSLSRTIVEEHGGRLWASPGEDCGATFHLQLPRRALHSAG